MGGPLLERNDCPQRGRAQAHAARRAIEPEPAPRAASSCLTAEGAPLRLDPRTVRIDADEAEALAEAALAHGGRAGLAAAVEAFTDDLLPEDRYAPWAEPRRERLTSLRERTLVALAAAHLTADCPEEAVAAAEQVLLAALLPSLGRVPARSGRSPEEERDRLFRATAGLLGELAAERPVMVVLDDLHAGDAGSFQLLGHLARRAREGGRAWRFLATVRPGELPAADPRRQVLDLLIRQSPAAVVELPRLSREACLGR
ncbi:AAA family ATPase [Streptomyces sp. NPDC002463]|uniref:bacterial transcriptional activator domain-containing protein n=1 Tax=Streptomyces sp. NPDC002463 TaxID=3364645 RepID=UPI00367550D7